jgi:DNA-binding GntR family transcriptional regulator
MRKLDSEAYLKHNSAFHAAIYQGARNDYLTELIQSTRRSMAFYHRSSLSQPARVRASWSEHGRVFDAIQGGDEAQAQEAMREHILYGGRVFADMIATLSKKEGQ